MRGGNYQLAVLGGSLAATSGKLDGKYLRAKAEHPDFVGGFLADTATKPPPLKASECRVAKSQRVLSGDFC